MRPTCYLLKASANSVTLYLGEVSTADCLGSLDRMDPITINDFGANDIGGGWISKSDLPAIGSVGELIQFLRDGHHIELIDFEASVGEFTISTHDDGEAQLTFPSEEQALNFLRHTLGPEKADRVIAYLLANRNRYVADHGDNFRSFETFEAYLAGG